jgi:flagellar biosynthesis protein FlhF
MKIRTLTGETMTAAMAKVREELGPDAVILHVEDTKSKKGVVIRAAADNPGADALSPQDMGLDQPAETRLEAELRARLRVFRPVLRRGGAIDPDDIVAPALAWHRTPRELAARLCERAGESGAGSDEHALAHALERSVAMGPLPARPSRPVIVLGAPGHGKSTVLARLAIQAAAAGAKPLMITLDTGKAGAVAQIETYGALIKAQVRMADGVESLKALVDARGPTDAVLIDTPGMNFWDPASIADAASWIAAAGAEPVWVASAEANLDDMIDAGRTMQQLGARRAIVTKADIARRFGPILAAAAASPIALSYLVSSAFLADGLEPVTPSALAARILQHAADARGGDPLPMQEAMSA